MSGDVTRNLWQLHGLHITEDHPIRDTISFFWRVSKLLSVDLSSGGHELHGFLNLSVIHITLLQKTCPLLLFNPHRHYIIILTKSFLLKAVFCLFVLEQCVFTSFMHQEFSFPIGWILLSCMDHFHCSCMEKSNQDIIQNISFCVP